MAKTMIERVARTLCRLDGHPENIPFEGKRMWESYRDTAIAVIEAMREPTDAMTLAGMLPDREASSGPVWQAMIDAVLAEQPQ